MAALLYFAVLCIFLLCATPTVQHVQKGDDDVFVGILMTAVNQLTEQVTAMKAQMTAQQNSLTSQGNRIAVLEANLNKLQTNVAFHVYSPAHVSATASGPIVLPSVKTNVGNGFDARTGFFTAPVSGLYQFHTNFMCAELKKYVTAGIYVDGDMVAATISDCRHGFYDSVSTEAVVHVISGQKVHLKNVNGFPSNYYGFPYTTFSGLLLRAD